MTENQMGGVRETAQQESAAVAHHAKEAAGEVRATAQQQAGQVAREAKAQAKHVVRDVRDKVAEKAEQQARKASSQLVRVADELSSMAEGTSSDSMTAGAIRQVAGTSRQAARFLDERGARGLLDSAQDLARRRPGAFLLGATVAGFLVGRVAKSATGQQDNGRHTAPQPERVVPPNTTPEFAAATPVPLNPDLSPMTSEPPYAEEGTTAPGAVTTGRDPLRQEPTAPGPVRRCHQGAAPTMRITTG